MANLIYLKKIKDGQIKSQNLKELSSIENSLSTSFSLKYLFIKNFLLNVSLLTRARILFWGSSMFQSDSSTVAATIIRLIEEAARLGMGTAMRKVTYPLQNQDREVSSHDFHVMEGLSVHSKADSELLEMRGLKDWLSVVAV